MKNDYNAIVNFLLLKEDKTPNMFEYIHALEELLSNVQPTTRRDNSRISVAREYVRHIRREAKRLEERVRQLEEGTSPTK